MKKNFATGLILLLPIAVTIAVINFLVNFLTKPFINIVSEVLCRFEFMKHGLLFLSPDQIILYTSKILILLSLFAVTVFLGVVTRWFFVEALLKLGDMILHKIPLINTVYKTTQDIIKTLFASDKNSFKQVVMVPFPRPGVYVLGLLVREAPSQCEKALNENLFSVLVPTTPNPTTGFLMMLKKEELIHVDIRPEDAIKYIVSCGVIIPGEKITPFKP